MALTRNSASDLGDSQSYPPKRHPSSSLCVCDKICEKTGLPGLLLQASRIAESRQGEGADYQIWAGLLSSRHIFFPCLYLANIKSPIYVSVSEAILRNKQIRLDDGHVTWLIVTGP